MLNVYHLLVTASIDLRPDIRGDQLGYVKLMQSCLPGDGGCGCGPEGPMILKPPMEAQMHFHLHSPIRDAILCVKDMAALMKEMDCTMERNDALIKEAIEVSIRVDVHIPYMHLSSLQVSTTLKYTYS